MTKRLSLNEISERLALPKTTVYYWIKDLPLGRERRWSKGQRKGTRSMQAKYRRLREEAYAQGWIEYDELVKLPTFRDFVALYIAEGYKRDRNRVSIANSDERVMALAAGWLRALTTRTLEYSVQYHADQDLSEICAFWGRQLQIDGSTISLQRKSNSSRLKYRIWRCKNGVLTIRVGDTYLRARLQAWIDRIRENWSLDCACSSPGRGAAR